MDGSDFRAVLDTVFAAPAYRWVEQPHLLRAIWEWWDRLGDWLHGLRAGHPLVFRLFVWVLLILLLLIVVHAAYVAFQTLHGAMRAAEPSAPGSRPGESRDAAWYRREADRAADEGRLLDALQLAFTGLALTLEGQGLLRYQASMTPAECARHATVADADRERLRGLVRTLYAHVFGGRPCAPEDYARWREASALPWHAAAY